MAEKEHKRLGDVLIEKGILTQKQLDNVILEQQRTREALGTILLRQGLIEEEKLLKLLSEQFDLAYISLKDEQIDWQLAMEFSPSLVVDHKCLPIKGDNNTVTVVITNPLDVWALSKAQEEADPRQLKVVLTSESEMKEAIREFRQQVRMSWL